MECRAAISICLGLRILKLTGSDKIPALFLKRCAHVLAKPLAHLFQVSLNTGIFPSSWKIADVIALHKKGSKGDVGNYRPISLLPIMSKLLESVVRNRLKYHISGRINPRQFGFRSGHTTFDQPSVEHVPTLDRYRCYRRRQRSSHGSS